MKVVIPLAGPDFILADQTVKAMIPVQGVPLLRHTLEGRAWWKTGQVTDADLVFVVQDLPPTRAFVQDHLMAWYPLAKVVLLSSYTRGAALSALAGVSLVAEAPGPLCIDLADIQFDSDFDPVAAFADVSCGAAVPCFPSDNPAYSYLRMDGVRVVEAAEKRVISGSASAGVYFFASTEIYLRALARSLADPASVIHNGLFFVCPLVNGVLAEGLEILVPAVRDVVDIKAAETGLLVRERERSKAGEL